jgi:predicted 2-oxoglutarate/Fe(II)-dependent dioxygenase YbiX
MDADLHSWRGEQGPCGEFLSRQGRCRWEDGRSTAGAQSALVKKNLQMRPDSEVTPPPATARSRRSPPIRASYRPPAIPLQIFPRLFDRDVAADGHYFDVERTRGILSLTKLSLASPRPRVAAGDGAC